MNHKIPFESLSNYLDNKCSEIEKKRMEEHLAGCGSCREAYAMLKKTDAAARNIERPELSPGFDRRFEQKLFERIKSTEEHKLSRIFNDMFENIRMAITAPAPVLARIAISLFVLVSTYGILEYAFPQYPVITLAKGDVSVYSAKDKRWVTGAKDMRLARGDIVETGAGSMADISQPDKYTVRLKDPSRITLAKPLSKYVGGRIVYRVAKGKAFFAIGKGFKGSRFTVETPEARATALGTEFLADVPVQPIGFTKFGVLEGRVEVSSLYAPREKAASGKVIVSGGEMTEVRAGMVPTTPRQLLDMEWQEMVEFYRIGDKPQVALLISNGKRRTLELLRPCPIYIFDVKPRTVSESLETTIKIIDNAIKTDDKAKHLEGIKKLEEIIGRHPNPNYEPQLLLFIGAYYNYIDMPEEAIKSFEKVAGKYPKSTFSSMALLAAGMIYDEKLKDRAKAQYYYNEVIGKYPLSPETSLLKELGKK